MLESADKRVTYISMEGPLKGKPIDAKNSLIHLVLVEKWTNQILRNRGLCPHLRLVWSTHTEAYLEKEPSSMILYHIWCGICAKDLPLGPTYPLGWRGPSPGNKWPWNPLPTASLHPLVWMHMVRGCQGHLYPEKSLLGGVETIKCEPTFFTFNGHGESLPSFAHHTEKWHNTCHQAASHALLGLICESVKSTLNKIFITQHIVYFSHTIGVGKKSIYRIFKILRFMCSCPLQIFTPIPSTL